MTETVERGNLRDQCQRIHEMLVQAHVILDDLMGSEPSINKVPGPAQPQAALQDLEVALDGINGEARGLTLRLEDLIKQV